MASVRYVTPDYFATLRIPLVRGRDVALSDTQTSQYVAVVSQSFAAAHWPDQDPLGQHFSIALQERVVAGVVGDVRVRGLERESEPQVYLPSPQVPDGGIIFYVPKDLVIRTAGAPAALVPAVRAAVARADPEQPISDVRTLRRHRPAGDLVALGAADRAAGVRVAGDPAGVSRHPRPAVVRGGGAHAGDRRADGVWRHAGSRPGPRARPDGGADRRGRGRGSRRGIRGEPVAAVPAGRRQSGRRAHVRDGRRCWRSSWRWPAACCPPGGPYASIRSRRFESSRKGLGARD